MVIFLLQKIRKRHMDSGLEFLQRKRLNPNDGLSLFFNSHKIEFLKPYSAKQFSPSCIHFDLSTSPGFLFQPKSRSVYSPCFQKS